MEFVGEEGTGLGPSLEFYALVAAELQQRSIGLWQCADNDPDNLAREVCVCVCVCVCMRCLCTSFIIKCLKSWMAVKQNVLLLFVCLRSSVWLTTLPGRKF